MKTETPAPPMTAVDIRACLMSRWPPADYVHIHEAPEDQTRMGRKIDLVVVSCWQSRGFEIEAVEIKVSVSDWRRELANMVKADFWWRHSHRFWIAVPKKIAATVALELPTTWGLLACTPEGSEVVVKATKHEAVPLAWHTTVGLLRCAQAAGLAALRRERDRGAAEGLELGKRQAEVAADPTYARRDLEALRKVIHSFSVAAGDRLDQYNAEQYGRIVAVGRKIRVDPVWARHEAERIAGGYADLAAMVRKMAADLVTLFALPDEEGQTNG
jgi:hypothetical protein